MALTQDAKGVHISTGAHASVAQQFRTHVRQGPKAGCGTMCGATQQHGGQAKVTDLGNLAIGPMDAVLQQDIAGLQVTLRVAHP